MGKYSKYALAAILMGIALYGAYVGSTCLYYHSPAYYKMVHRAQFMFDKIVSPGDRFLNSEAVARVIPGKRCRLELLDEIHFIDYAAAFSKRIKNYLDLPPDLEDRAILEWLGLELVKQAYGRQITYVAFHPESNEVVGSLCISKISLPDYGQIFGWLNEKHWGSGITQEALKLALGEFFRVTGDTESNAYIRPFNVRCYLALKKMGFTPAGRTVHSAFPGSYIMKITEKTIRLLDATP